MVEALQLKTPLEDGRILLARLREAGIDVQAALWVHVPDEESEKARWLLYIASSLVYDDYSLHALHRLQEILNTIDPPLTIDLSDLRPVSVRDPIIRLYHAIAPGAREAKIPWGQYRDGRYEEAYAYELPLEPPAPRRAARRAPASKVTVKA
jgi:hypothetical protein